MYGVFEGGDEKVWGYCRKDCPFAFYSSYAYNQAVFNVHVGRWDYYAEDANYYTYDVSEYAER